MEMTKATGQSILELVVKNNLVNIPKIIEVVDFDNGQIDDKMAWGKFKVRDVEEFEALKKIGKEDLAQEITVKLLRYGGQDLNAFIGKKLLTENFSLDFDELKGKYGNSIVGLKFVANFDELELAR